MEAVTAIARWLLLEQGFERLGLRAAPGNEASQRVAEKAGFTREGVARNAGFTNAGRVDLVVFSLTRSDLDQMDALEPDPIATGEDLTNAVSDEDRPSYANPVKAWTNPETWAERLTPEGCPFCPMEPSSVHVELPASWVLVPDEAVLPGYVLVVSKRHVIEPYELPPDESAQFWADAMRAASAVASVVRPIKVNYEIHGNTIPHLHLHVFPRFRGDPFERSPIDPHAVAPARRTPAELEALRSAIARGT